MVKITTMPISPELEQLIDQIDAFKDRWQTISDLAPEQLKTLRRIATIESVGSSTRIEGSALSDREVEKLLSGLRMLQPFHWAQKTMTQPLNLMGRKPFI